jgi:hypothetical protein
MERTHVPWPIGLPVPVKQDRSPKMRPYYSSALWAYFCMRYARTQTLITADCRSG